MSKKSRPQIDDHAEHFTRRKSRWLRLLMFSFCLMGLAYGSDKPAALSLASPLTASNVGQKMPPFTARDQFGHDISSDGLKGPNGTVLLFFRSADW